MALGDNAQDSLRTEAIERFIVHIERWLQNTRQDLYGDGSIPYVSAEGNRVVAAYQVDPATSEGLPQTGEDDVADPVAIEHNAAEGNAAEVQEAGGSTPTENVHRPANKSAFG
jgi:hypothetical protein